MHKTINFETREIYRTGVYAPLYRGALRSNYPTEVYRDGESITFLDSSVVDSLTQAVRAIWPTRFSHL